MDVGTAWIILIIASFIKDANAYLEKTGEDRSA